MTSTPLTCRLRTSNTPSHECCYQPMTSHLGFSIIHWLTALVRQSANWLTVSMGCVDISFRVAQSRKWWSLTFECFVLGRHLWVVAISNAPLLSLNASQCIFGTVDRIGKPNFFISFSNSIVWMASLRAQDRPACSLSVDESAVSVCNWDFQLTGQPACIMMHRCLDLAVSRLWDSAPSQFPLKSALTKTSMSLLLASSS
jgi:hypothetical protein